VDRILIEKSKRTVSLISGTETLKTYKVALGGKPVGAKDRKGDHKTPEGTYTIDGKVPNSKFHKALHISYLILAIGNARKSSVFRRAVMQRYTGSAKAGRWFGAKR
jgi:hypothetical protein